MAAPTSAGSSTAGDDADALRTLPSCCGLDPRHCGCPEVVKSSFALACSEVGDGHKVHWLTRGLVAGGGERPDIFYCSICRDYLQKPHNRNLLAKGIAVRGLSEKVIKAHTRVKDGDHAQALKAYCMARGIQEPGSMLLFYQYVRPAWSDEERERMRQWLEDTCTELQICGRVKVASEGINVCASALTANAHAFEERLKSTNLTKANPFAPLFRDTLVKYNQVPLSELFPKLKVFLVKEIVGFGVAVNDFEPVQKLTPAEWHQKMEEPGVVMIDVRNYYETRIGRFVAPGGRFVGVGDEAQLKLSSDAPRPVTETIDPQTRYFTEFPDWVQAQKESLQGRTVMVY